MPGPLDAFASSTRTISVDHVTRGIAAVFGDEPALHWARCCAAIPAKPSEAELTYEDAGLALVMWLTADADGIAEVFAALEGLRPGGAYLLGPEQRLLTPIEVRSDPELKPWVGRSVAECAGLALWALALRTGGAGDEPKADALVPYVQGFAIRSDEAGSLGVDIDVIINGRRAVFVYGDPGQFALLVTRRHLWAKAVDDVFDAGAETTPDAPPPVPPALAFSDPVPSEPATEGTHVVGAIGPIVTLPDEPEKAA